MRKILLLLLIATSGIYAGNVVRNSSGNNSTAWATGSAWNTGVAPTTNDVAIFNDTSKGISILANQLLQKISWSAGFNDTIKASTAWVRVGNGSSGDTAWNFKNGLSVIQTINTTSWQIEPSGNGHWYGTKMKVLGSAGWVGMGAASAITDTFNQTDSILIYGNKFSINTSVASGVFSTWNTNGNYLQFSSFGYFGGISTSMATLNLGGSNVVVSAWIEANSTTNYANFNLQASTITDTGTWTNEPNWIVNSGTSTVRIVPIASATITNHNQTFYNFRNVGSTGILSQLADSMTVNGNFIDSTGKFKSQGFNMNFSGNYSRYSQDTNGFSTSTLTFNNPATWTRHSTLNDKATKGATLRNLGGMTFAIDSPMTFSRIYNALGKHLIGTAGVKITDSSYTSGDWNNDTVKLGKWNLPKYLTITNTYFQNVKMDSVEYDTASNGGYNGGGDSLIMFKDAAGYKYLTPTSPHFDSIRPVRIAREGGTALTGYVRAAYTPDSLYNVAGNYRTIMSQTDTTILHWTSVAGSEGWKNYSMVNADNVTATLTNAIFLYATPTIDSVTSAGANPGTGSPAGGTAVRIRGSGFLGAGPTSASLGGVALTSVVVVDSGTITGITGAHAAGTVTASVTNGDTVTGTKTNAFTYFVPFKISSISPSHGLIASWDTIRGVFNTGDTLTVNWVRTLYNDSSNVMRAFSLPAGIGTVWVKLKSITGLADSIQFSYDTYSMTSTAIRGTITPSAYSQTVYGNWSIVSAPGAAWDSAGATIWTTTGGMHITDPTAASTTAWMTSSGTVTATYYSRAPQVPALGNPTNGGTSSNGVMTWGNAVDSVFILQTALDTGMTATVTLDTTTGTSKTRTYTVGQKVFWYVKGGIAGSWSAWSAEWSFTATSGRRKNGMSLSPFRLGL
jgi:hypothetical protein